MMKHELEKQLDALEKKGVDRRHFFKLLAATGLIAGVNTGKANAFSSSAKGKIVIIGGGAAGISMAARLILWLDLVHKWLEYLLFAIKTVFHQYDLHAHELSIKP